MHPRYSVIAALQCSSTPRQEQTKPQTAAKAAQTNPAWRAGTYLGLTAGKSTRADVVQILGEPKRLDTPADQTPNEPNPEIWYVYDSGGVFPGELTVVINKDTGIVLAINLNPDSLSKADAVKYFGPDYILTRYDFDECLGNEESAPMYESPTGSLLEVEYRHRGIAISVDDRGNVNTISYVSRPIGASSSRCKSSTEKNEAKGHPKRPQ